MKYEELREKQTKEIDNFPMIIAWSKSSLEKGIKEKGWNEDDVCSIGYGCYTLEKDKNDFIELLKRNKEERLEFAKDFDNLVDMICYEMFNHEYQICIDEETTTENILSTIDEEIQKYETFDDAWKIAESKICKHK